MCWCRTPACHDQVEAARNLAAGDAAAVRKRSDKQRIDRSLTLQNVQNWLDTLVGKRNRPNLDTDRLFGVRGLCLRSGAGYRG